MVRLGCRWLGRGGLRCRRAPGRCRLFGSMPVPRRGHVIGGERRGRIIGGGERRGYVIGGGEKGGRIIGGGERRGS